MKIINGIYRLVECVHPEIREKVVCGMAFIIGSIFRICRVDTILEKYFGVNRRVVVKIDGGLGSQMWQFALGYCIAQKLKFPLYLETEFFRRNKRDGLGNINREFLLFDTFPVIKERYSSRILKPGATLWLKFLIKRPQKSIYDIEPTIYEHRFQYLHAYYSNVKYIQSFLSELKEMFTFDVQLSEKENEIKQRMNDVNSCYVHIRRGDFVGTYHEVCSDAYYLKAMSRMIQEVKNVEFFVFSNDEKYARSLCETHGFNENVYFVENRSENDPRVDMYLMTNCKHSIIANSGFSWFPAWLKSNNPNSVTIMPCYWTSNPELKEISRHAMHVPNWIQIDGE